MKIIAIVIVFKIYIYLLIPYLVYKVVRTILIDQMFAYVIKHFTFFLINKIKKKKILNKRLNICYFLKF